VSGIASRNNALGRVTLARNHRANSVRFVTSGASPVGGVAFGNNSVGFITSGASPVSGVAFGNNCAGFVTSGASPVGGVVSGTIAVSGVALPRIDWASAVSSVASARNP